ncbi:MAG: FtsQ-type POTRA domain-containing protein [Clostridia bacterium]|nr:FtsQ-type POTRA domain-containing protein [Clostridia bacterium]
MNAEKTRNDTRRAEEAELLSPNRTPRAVRKKPNQGLMRLLRAAMLLMGGMILVFGLLLIVLPIFKVSQVEVAGNSFYTAEQLAEASGIEVGDELLAVDMQDAVNRILKACPNVAKVSIGVSFPFGITITVEERTDVMYTEYNGKHISLDRSFRVLEMIDSGETRFSPFLYVQLPKIASVSVGGKIVFADAAADLTYVGTLLDFLKEKELLADVTEVDFSERFSVSYTLQGRCRVELGSVSALDTKLLLVNEILNSKGGIDAAYAVIDVSDTQKPTYRVVDASELSDFSAFIAV